MLLKRASARISRVLDSFEELEPGLGAKRFASIRKTAAAHEPILLDNTRFAYLRVRAVSAGEEWGPNDNGDFFPDAELAARHGTFLYCPVYLDHQNWDARDAVGIVVACVYHPTPRPGGWVELIHAIDKSVASKIRISHLPGNPDLLSAIREGGITDTSMGCFVEQSECSICGNRAAEVYEYCPHIANSKGLPFTTASGEQRVAYEVNYGPVFFEDSIIRTTIAIGGGGADQGAKILSEVIASAGPSDWRRLLIDRRALVEGKKESVMTKPVTAGTDADQAALAVGAEGQVTFEPVAANYPIGTPPDPDKDTEAQAKKKSAPVSSPSNASPDRLSQNGDPKDYAHTAGKVATAASADPDSTIGGEPENVSDAKEEAAEDKKEALEEHQEKEDGEDEGGEKKEGMSLVRRLSHAIAGLVGWNARVKEGEGLLAMQDYIRDVTAEHKRLLAHAASRTSRLQRQAAMKDVAIAEGRIRKSLAIVTRAVTDPKFGSWLDKKMAAAGGNPQELVDRGDYGPDPDSDTHDQLGRSSDGSRQTSLGNPDQVAVMDRGDYGQRGAVTLASAGWVRGQNGSVVTADRRVVMKAAEVNGTVDRIIAAMESGKSYAVAEREALAAVARSRPAVFRGHPKNTAATDPGREGTPAGRSVVRAASGREPSRMRTAETLTITGPDGSSVSAGLSKRDDGWWLDDEDSYMGAGLAGFDDDGSDSENIWLGIQGGQTSGTTPAGFQWRLASRRTAVFPPEFYEQEQGPSGLFRPGQRVVFTSPGGFSSKDGTILSFDPSSLRYKIDSSDGGVVEVDEDDIFMALSSRTAFRGHPKNTGATDPAVRGASPAGRSVVRTASGREPIRMRTAAEFNPGDKVRVDYDDEPESTRNYIGFDPTGKTFEVINTSTSGESVDVDVSNGGEFRSWSFAPEQLTKVSSAGRSVVRTATGPEPSQPRTAGDDAMDSTVKVGDRYEIDGVEVTVTKVVPHDWGNRIHFSNGESHAEQLIEGKSYIRRLESNSRPRHADKQTATLTITAPDGSSASYKMLKHPDSGMWWNDDEKNIGDGLPDFMSRETDEIVDQMDSGSMSGVLSSGYKWTLASRRTSAVTKVDDRGSGDGGAWVTGNTDGYDWMALAFEEGSFYGINGGQVSKLQIVKDKGLGWNPGSDNTVYNYDRGLDVDKAPPGLVDRVVAEASSAVSTSS